MLVLKDFPKMSDMARKFIYSKPKYIPNPVRPSYEFLSTGADLPKLPVAKESQIHKYLSPFAITEDVFNEFGHTLNYIV